MQSIEKEIVKVVGGVGSVGFHRLLLREKRNKKERSAEGTMLRRETKRRKEKELTFQRSTSLALPPSSATRSLHA